MNAESNWDKNWAMIGQLENKDTHVTNVYTMELADGLHYAIVHWRYRVPGVLMELANGKIIYGGEE